MPSYVYRPRSCGQDFVQRMESPSCSARCGVREQIYACSRLPRQDLLSSKLCRKSRAARLRRLSTTREDKATSRDLLEDVEGQQFPFQLPKQPKFQPFIGESDTRQLLAAFQHEVHIPDGKLLISAMAEEHIPQATELLATSFADAVGYMPMYRGLLKQEVQTYLRSHLNIAPKAVILVAVLKPAGRDDDQEGDSKQPENHGENPLTSSRDAGDSEESYSLASEGVSNPLQQGAELQTQLLDSLGVRGSSSNPPSDGSSFNDAAESIDEISEEGQPATSPSNSYSTFSASKAAALRQPAAAQSSADATMSSNASMSAESNRQQGCMAEESGDPSLESQRDNGAASDAEAQGKQELSCNREATGPLIGTVELSFSQSTRTPSVTLNPPKDCAYLCNMAVGEEFQRQGYGTRLLIAAEEVVRLAGFRRIYLHVRLRDEPAKGLYSKAGFELEKEDCLLVSLWDHRRQLLSKFLPSRPQVNAAASQEQDPEPIASEF